MPSSVIIVIGNRVVLPSSNWTVLGSRTRALGTPFVVITVAATLGLSKGFVVAASLIIPVVHLFRQMKQAYELRWYSAVLRTLALLVGIWIVVIIFLLLLVLLGMT